MVSKKVCPSPNSQLVNLTLYVLPYMVKERIVRYMKKDVINLGSWEEEFVLDFPVPLQLVMSVLMIEKQRTIPQRQEEAM